MYKGLTVLSWLLLIAVLLGRSAFAQSPTLLPCGTPTLPFTNTLRPTSTTIRLSTLTPTTTVTSQPPAVLTALPNATWLDQRDLPYYQTAVWTGDQVFRDATARAQQPTATQEELSLYTPTPKPQTYVVQVAALNVRKTPGTTGALNGTVRQNERIVIYGYSERDGYMWGQFGAQQWIALVVYNANGEIAARWAVAVP